MKDKIEGYTPGPWKFERLSNFVWAPFNHERICEFDRTSPYSDDGDVIKANARLIVLAPTLYEQHFKMLEALKEIVTELSPVYNFDLTRAPEFVQKALQTIKECEL